MKKSLSLLLASALLISSTQCNQSASVSPDTSLFAEVMRQHLASLPATAPTIKKPFSEKTFSEKTLFEKTTNQEEPTFEITPLSEHDEAIILYGLMHSQLSRMQETILSKQCCKDLELVYGSYVKENNALALISRAHLTETKIFLATLLSHPISDIEELKKRQDIIKTFTNNPDLRTELNDLFADLKKNHAPVMHFWGTGEQATKMFIDTQYWSFNPLKPLNSNLAYQHTSTTFQTILMPIMTVAPQIMVNWLMGFALFSDNPNSGGLSAGTVGTIVGINAYMGICTVLMANQCRILIQTLNHLHEKTISIAQITSALDALEKQIQKHPELKHLQQAQVISDFAKTKKSLSVKMKKLILLLHTKTFKGKPTFFALQGRVRVAYALIEEIKGELVPALIALAEIEAYLSCANLYLEHEGKENGYTFATYLEQDTPYIKVDGMWNPFVGSKKSIANSIELGGNAPLNIILTGPNAGGKSTFSKGLTLNVLLAQTIGIVPAKALSFTPFAKINTYMNIADDTAGGNSLFKSEVMRVQELLKTITNLPKNQFSFSVMDEIFSGTSPREGEAAGYAVAKNIRLHKNSIAVIATHFPRLKKLEAESSDFKNYQVRVIKNSDGTLTYPFKLELGAADQNVAFDILKLEGLDGSIVADAYAALNESSEQPTIITA